MERPLSLSHPDWDFDKSFMAGVCCIFEMEADNLNILTNRIHGSFNNRSTTRIWEILRFACLTLPTQVQFAGNHCDVLVLSVVSRGVFSNAIILCRALCSSGILETTLSL